MARSPRMSNTKGDESIDPADVDYSRRVGERLRAIRRQKKLSLHEVDEVSKGEFKASVVGAYERGERAIS
ncbi:MAG: helix-turn-helix domain-containing protein, partial [Ilumatobacteraceae bacterium]